MAIDQTPLSSPPESTPIAAIENEFPTYRAISSTAVMSLMFGLGSVFCFTSLWFLVVVAISVALGLLALRKIRQLPDVLTGAGYARVGIGLAALFGLTAVTQILTQEGMIWLDARQFAIHYIEVIKDKPVNEALWYEQNAEYRNTKSPDEIVEELKKMKSPTTPDPYGEKAGPFLRMKNRLKGEGEEIRFSKIESKAIDGLTVYANALLELRGPGSKDFPEKEQYALIQMVKTPDGGRDDWMVREVTFPYTPASTVATVQKHDDDGHGH